MNAETSLTVTHNIIITDRSRSGTIAIAQILEICPSAKGQVNAWRNSSNLYFLFIAEHGSGHVGSVTARDVDHLLSGVLPELLSTNLTPAAHAEFDVFCKEPDSEAIYDGINQLMIATALEAGRKSAGRAPDVEPVAHVRERRRIQEETTADLNRRERERAIRFLCRMWFEPRLAGVHSLHQLQFADFEEWLRANGYSHYLVAGSNRHREVDAVAWFSDELTRVRRANG